ncbi:MAG: RNA methyltransferase [Sporomusaceae bacterium]|nr:RNA methyltransferase [Sporomusaceae bacterium]
MSLLYLGLVHHPIYNKNSEIVATAVTNFDIHDIARASRTYGVRRYFIIHPLDSQLELVDEVLGYWRQGYGAAYNPDRCDALSVVQTARSIAECTKLIEQEHGKSPYVVTTDARQFANSISYRALRAKLETQARPCLLLFGTGWGIERTVMEQFDYILEPVLGSGDYNHLSVRSAVSIILDRLAGEAWWQRQE